MKKFLFIPLLIIFICFSLTGCYDSTSLEKFYYAIAISIDKSESSNIKLSIQVASPNKSSESSSSQLTNTQIYSVDCENIDLGINIINNFLSKQINLSHCTAIIFSEEMAKKGVKEYINSLANNPEIRPDTHIFICQTQGLDILENVSKSGEKFSSKYFEFVINTVESTGYSSQSEFGPFFYAINSNNNTVPTANYIIVENDTVQAVGIEVNKKDKYIFYLDSMQSLAHLIVNNRLKESIISISNPYNNNNKIDISIKKGKKANTTNVKIINNTPFFISKIYISGKITNMPNFSEKDDIKIIEKKCNSYLKNIIENYYYITLKEKNSDLPNLSTHLSKQYLTTTAFNKLNFNSILKESFYQIFVDSSLTTSLYSEK